jgi:hypothetical protein
MPGWTAWLAIPAAFAALMWSCHGALPGTAVADDYSFLHSLAFGRPLDWFGSMGATYYWRPLSRQLYFSLLGPGLLNAPWTAAATHAALLLALAILLHRIARRFAPAPVAAMVACFPLLAEPARVLLGWPSGAQHLLAGTAAALAVHEGLAGRVAVAGLAAFAGLLSHESAALALPVIPFAAASGASDRGRARPALVAGAIVAGIAVATWAAGYAVALSHRIALPVGQAAPHVAGLPGLYGRALRAALGLEDVGPVLRDPLLAGHALLFLVAVAMLLRPAARARLAAARPAIAAGAAWFAVGILPLVLLLPDWNAWRAWTPTLGLAVAGTLLLGAASPALAGGWVLLRLVALLASPAAITSVPALPPVDGSHESFRQITRLQRLATATRDALLARYPRVPSRSTVVYFEVPRLAEFAFQGSRALQVWYADSSLVWDRLGGRDGLDRSFAAGVEFLVDDPRIAIAIDDEAMRAFQRAAAAMDGQRLDEADSLLAAVPRLQPRQPSRFVASAVFNRARIALLRGDVARADSLCRNAMAMGLDHADVWAFQAVLGLQAGDRARVENAVRRVRERDPRHPDLPRLIEMLGAGR